MIVGRTDVIDENSKIPKYLQVANSFIENIICHYGEDFTGRK